MKKIELRETRAVYMASIEDIAQSAEPVVIERDGNPVAVVVPYSWYRQMISQRKPHPSDHAQMFERNRAAYLAQRAELLKTHRGQWIAFHNEQLVDSDRDEAALLERVHAKYAYGTCYIHLLQEPEYVYRIPSPRLVRDL
jgi:PHD/YefM family antitoxin component YafN of YafNO toxin-antitoxin module